MDIERILSKNLADSTEHSDSVYRVQLNMTVANVVWNKVNTYDKMVLVRHQVAC